MQTNFLFSTNINDNKLSHKDILKHAVKEYGVTVIIFHIGIALLSLGGCYLVVTRYVLQNIITCFNNRSLGDIILSYMNE